MCIYKSVPFYFFCEFLALLYSSVEFKLFYFKLIVCFLLKKINLSIDVPPFVIKWNYWNSFRILYYSTFTVTMGVGSVPWELMFWVWDTLLFLVISIEHLPLCSLRTAWSACCPASFLGHHPEFSLFSAIPCSCYNPLQTFFVEILLTIYFCL